MSQSASKVILKHSSVLGKRPTSANLIAGELGLNTNSQEPGLFCEVTDGHIVKLGPPAVLPLPPIDLPERGELWYSLEDGTLRVGGENSDWEAIAAPYLGGGGYVVFVAPEYEKSTDSLLNDGQALPYQTITRAILELSKHYINRVISGFPKTQESNRYTIYLASSAVSVNNGPGVPISDFNVDFSTNPLKEVLISELEQFNSGSGGVIVPFGISIIGIDLKKCTVRPSYIPSFYNPNYPEELSGTDQPLSSVFKCSGNAYLSNFSATDKSVDRNVISVTEKETLAVFHTNRPHNLYFNDRVQVTVNPQVNQSLGTFTSGSYYAIPIDTFSFYLSSGPQNIAEALPYTPFSSIPPLPADENPKFNVTNTLNSAHRLHLFSNVSLSEIGEYFTKVQKAFSSFFGGAVTSGDEIVNAGDYEIVAPTLSEYPDNEVSNSVKNSSLYINQVNLRSEYGMCGGDFDGAIVTGFKSVIVNSSTVISIQNDPSVYEIYTTLLNPETGLSEQKWWNLTLATFLSTPLNERPASLAGVSVESQLDLLNSTPITDIRYYYQNLKTSEGKSIGIVDVERDFRHFAFRVRNGCYGQFQSLYTIGPAVGVWALNGGICALTNSTSNFGSVSFKAEGFEGINTIGGARPNSTGFVLEGIQRPLALTKGQTESVQNKRILSLGARVVSVYIDPEDTATQIIELSADFLPCYLLPYSLKPGSALWIDTEDCTYRGFLSTDGGPTILTGLDDPASFAKVRIRASDSTIPNSVELDPTLGIPYIRRFLDPRRDFERGYSLYIRNTFQNAISPQVGSVLRLNQTSQQLSSASLRPNVQFDPGVLGGWGRVFTVDAVETGSLGSSPQFNYAIGDTNQDQTYFIAVTTTDYSRPWGQGPEYKLPVGTYTTFRSKNWYTAENNLWDSVYFGEAENFTETFGPYSLAPSESCSPFVQTSVIERQDIVSDTFQGIYAPDPLASVGDETYDSQTYLRGSTDPYPTFPTQSYYDDDDSSESLGLCLKSTPSGLITSTVSSITIVQSEQPASSFARYRPEIVEFSVLSSTSIQNPKQAVSVIRLGTSSNCEYIRVINLNGTLVRGLRLTSENSSYPSNYTGAFPNWPALTPVSICETDSTPASSLYDPDWISTKRAVFRFFEVMGYSKTKVAPFLSPKFWGERLLQITTFNDIAPENGYAVITDKWPLEFNAPSTVIANTHTWAYSGYYNYSRGLPRFQTNDIPRKLSSDFQATTMWSGRLTVTGINDKGEIVLFGPQRQALTSNYYEDKVPTSNPANQQIYEAQPFVEFPSQVVVFSADDISDQFNGILTSFQLLRGGLTIPPDQLSVESIFVILGAVVQKPGVDYNLTLGSLVFTTAPPPGASCNIRVVTSADSFQTLVCQPISFKEAFDGSRVEFTAETDTGGTLSLLEVDANNTFVYLGGVQQIPFSTLNPSAPYSYTVIEDSGQYKFTFTEPPPVDTLLDARCITTGSYWSSRSILPVKVYSLDPIDGEFDGAKLTFDLTFGGIPANPATITADNLFVSLGGALQIPGTSYLVNGSQITFLDNDPPEPGTSINIRVVSNSEFLSCPNSGKYGGSFMQWGPGIVLSLANQAGMLA